MLDLNIENIINNIIMSHPIHRSCVFCGQLPDSKNLEHVIPQWLIRKTGNPKRIFQWGQMTENGLTINKNIPFDQFKFPSCITCNSKYSILEAQAKTVFEKIESGIPIHESELDNLLDWFDKIRIGIWLAQIYLNKNKTPINPTFFIEQRIGKKDRYLAIFRRNQIVNRCSIPCVATPAFEFMPSAAGFIFNDFGFISISDDYLFSKNLGWPFPIKKIFYPNGYASITLKDGLKSTKKPILPFKIDGTFTQIFQTVADIELSKTALYDNEYIKQSLMANSQNKGTIRVYNQSYDDIFPDKENSFYCTPNFSNEKGETFVHLLSIQTLKIQNHLWNFSSAPKGDKKHQKEYDKLKNSIINFNESQIKSHRKSIIKIEADLNFTNNSPISTKNKFHPFKIYKFPEIIEYEAPKITTLPKNHQ